MVEITFTRRAMRDIRKLPKDMQRRIEMAIDELFDDIKAGDRRVGRILEITSWRLSYHLQDKK